MTEFDPTGDGRVRSGASEFERARLLFREGRGAEAEALCRAILERSPDDPRALQLLGLVRFAAGDVEPAISLLERALALNPDDAIAEFNLGAALAAVQRFDQAARHYERAALLQPDLIEAQARLGAVLHQLGRFGDAEAALRSALVRAPDHPLVLANLAGVLFDQGRLEAAVEAARGAVERAPEFMPAHLQLGRALTARGEIARAVEHLKRAHELAPAAPEPANLLTNALYEARSLDEARTVGRKAIERHPDDPTTVCNLAAVEIASGNSEAGIALYRQAVRLAPDRPLYHRNLLCALLYSPHVHAAERFEAHVAFGRAMAARVDHPLVPITHVRSPGRKLRVGWLSSDFRNHPVTVNLGLLLSCRDRSRFEFFAYADVLNPDELTRIVRRDMDQWRSIEGLSDEAVARMIRADEIDIMVYLAGRFDGNRPQVAAWRPAPVQVSLHDPATSGIAAMDYLIADPVLVPRAGGESFTERVVRLPSFYAHPPIETAVAPMPPPPRAAGRITFGSFNNPAKINERVLALWAEVLHRVPHSRLRLKYRQLFANAGLQERLRRGLGVDDDRVEFVTTPDPTVEDHLRAVADVDVALDTFPFTGSTTTFETLWMGVPVVTLRGDAMASRWSASILHTLKLDSLIAATPGDYVAIAARLAADPDALLEMRATLRDRIRRSPVCNGPLRARQFERLLDALWRRWQTRTASPPPRSGERQPPDRGMPGGTDGVPAEPFQGR